MDKSYLPAVQTQSSSQAAHTAASSLTNDRRHYALFLTLNG